MKFVRAAAVAILVAAAAACSDDAGGASSSSSLKIDEIAAAIQAVDAVPAADGVGAELRFYEVNATPTLVNLFVANPDNTVTAFVYLDGVLDDGSAPAQADGQSFAASAVSFDAETVLDQVAEELPDSAMRGFSAVSDGAAGVRYLITIESVNGGILEIPVGPDGSILTGSG